MGKRVRHRRRAETDRLSSCNEPKWIEESCEIRMRNHKKGAGEGDREGELHRWSNWEITKNSDQFEKQDSRTIHIPVDAVEKVVTYTVKLLRRLRWIGRFRAAEGRQQLNAVLSRGFTARLLWSAPRSRSACLYRSTRRPSAARCCSDMRPFVEAAIEQRREQVNIVRCRRCRRRASVSMDRPGVEQGERDLFEPFDAERPEVDLARCLSRPWRRSRSHSDPISAAADVRPRRFTPRSALDHRGHRLRTR